MDSRRILFVVQYYPPEIGGGAVRFRALAYWLAQQGHQVTVLTSMPNYPLGVVQAAYRGKLAVSEVVDGVEVLRVWNYPATYGSPMRRLANYLSFSVFAVARALFAGRRFDVIIAGSPPLFVALAGWLLGALWHLPWIFDIGDLWPDVAVEAGEMKPGSLSTRLLSAMARHLYKKAAHLTPVTDTKREKLTSKGICSEKITVIPNGVDFERISEIERGDWRARLNLEDRFIVLYAGLIGIAQGVEIIADAAAAVRDETRIHFMIVGDGVRRHAVEARAKELDLANLTLLPVQPHREIVRLLREADVAWVPLVRSELTDAVPSKLLEAWACTKPVIVTAGGEAAQLVGKVAGGVITRPGDSRQLAEAIRRLSAAPATQLACYGQAGYEYARQWFDYKTITHKMGNVLIRVLA